MLFEHYLLLILSILPIYNRYSFWLYVIQLKEYRFDRFKEYILTAKGKSAILNIWFYVELPLLSLTFIVFFNKPFEIIVYNIIFIYLLMQNLFVARKLIKRNILKPKLTGRLLLTLSLLFIGFGLDLSYFILTGFSNQIYSYLMFILIFSPLVLFFIVFISLPIVSHLKNKKISKAVEKSEKISNPIKIAVTGSYGKSSVKEYLSSILEQDGKTLKTPENINTELGVSDIVLNKLNNTYKYFVAEAGAYKIGEIETLGKIINHKYGFLTAIGNQHIGLFGSQENIKKGKSEIANKVLENNGILYINGDNEELTKTKFDKKVNIVKYGINNGNEAKSEILGIKDGITEFNFVYKNNNSTFKTELLGKHNIINLTGVIAFCYDIGLKTTEIKKYLKNIKSPKNTLNIIKKDNYTLIDDSYNLSEQGLYSGIEAINSFKGNKVLIMDDILELGNEAENIHYKVGLKIAKEKNINQILFSGINYKQSFIKGLLDGGFKKENIIKNIENLEKNSIILFEGRSTQKYLNKIK